MKETTDAPATEAPAPGARPSRIVPLIIGTALFVQVLDATVISTALPTMARTFGHGPVALSAAITSYLLATACFLPLAGWVADQFGAKRVFQVAIFGFALSSLACGLAQTLPELIAARLVQGMAGSFMTPVGRLILLRSFAKPDLVWAISYLSLPALLGPMLGPPIGGLIVTFASWRWIFFINLPLAIAAIALSARFLPTMARCATPKLDVGGFVLSGLGLAGLIYGLSNADNGTVSSVVASLLFGGGLLCLGLYWLHARRTPQPLIDFRLLAVPTFRAAALGGLFSRLINGANPFLLVLLLQVGFGLSAFQAGLLTLANAAGALLMRALAPTIIERFGYRRALIFNAVVSAAMFGGYALFRPATPHVLIFAGLLAGGFFRSLQFTALNGMAFENIRASEMSRASTFWSVTHQVTQSLGVSLAVVLVQASRGPGPTLAWTAISPAFVAISLLSLVSTAFFAKLSPDVGRPPEEPPLGRHRLHTGVGSDQSLVGHVEE